MQILALKSPAIKDLCKFTSHCIPISKWPLYNEYYPVRLRLMKIYALDFRIELRPHLPSAHFTWQRLPLAEIAEQLHHKGVDFPDQMFYAEASMESLDLVRSLLEDANVAGQRATLVLFLANPDEVTEFFEALRNSYRPETAAGGLVRNDSDELLLIERLGRWDLPKGKVEEGESLEEAAIREVAEETGLTGHTLGPHFMDTFHVFKRKKKWKFKVTHWYLMTVGRDREGNRSASDTTEGMQEANNHGHELKPQTEEGITEVKWWSKEDLAKQLPPTYPLIEDLLQKITE